MSRPLRRIFPGQHSQVAHARDFVRRAAGPCCPLLDEATLLTSELCTNALQHTASGAGGSFEVTVFRQPDALRVEVRDEGADTKPAVRSLADMSENGHGLEIVHTLADRWGQNGDGFGRTVFFELRWAPTLAQTSTGDDPAQHSGGHHQDDQRMAARR